MVRRIVLGALLLATTLGVGRRGWGAEGGIGGLLIAPTRIALEPRDRSAELTLLNRGTVSATYRLSLVEKRMTEDGRLEDVSEGVEVPASVRSLVRYSPRQVRLAPGQTQKVRFLVRRPKDLPPGEYRSHLLVQTLPEVPSGAESKEGEGLRIQLTTVTGVSIPVIVRHGRGAVSVVLDDLALGVGTTGGLQLGLALAREGNRSTYGDLEVTVAPAGGGASRVVGRLRGVAVYTPNHVRRAVIPLSLSAEEARAGSLHVTYRRPEDEGGGLMAQGDLRTP